MEKKISAVEWLVLHLNKEEWFTHKQKQTIQQAKAMEKEQIIKTAQDNFHAGQDLANGYKIDWNSAEQYYNETFKSE